MKNLNPVWNETLTLEHIDVHDIECKTLHIAVFDWDRLTRDDLIGTATIDLSTIDAHATDAQMHELTLQGAKGGVLHITLRVERELASRDAARIANLLVSRLKANRKQFDDPDFPHDNRSLFNDTKLHTINAETKKPDSKYQWMRLSQLTAGAAVFVDGTSSNDIVQGSLGDCYLLGALSVLATRKDLVSSLFTTVNASLGLFQVRFFKNEWLTVTVDDFVPVVNKTPVYGRCSDAREFWVPLVEKAYAKLHGSYESIETGSVASALIDLTGEAPESVVLADARADLAALWSKLLHATSEGYLMGCSSAKGGVEEDLGNGILGNHAYAVLRAVQVGTLRLIECRNPWHGDKEWTGAWSDKSDEWAKNPVAAKQVGFKPGADGAFWMSLEDFSSVFTNLWILRLLCDRVGHKWHRYESRSAWLGRTAGGCCNFPTFGDNPQYGVTAKYNDTKLYIALLQPDKRTLRIATYKSSLGINIVKAAPVAGKNDPFHRVQDVSKIEKTVAYAPERSVICEYGPMKVGERVAILPALFDAGVESPFTLIVFASNQIEFGEVPLGEPLEVKGSWHDKNSGGCVNHDSWSDNPFYMLKSDIKCAVTIKLEQAERDELFHIGISFGKSPKPDKKAIDRDEPCVNARAVSFETTLEPLVQYFIVPQTFNPGCFTSFKLQVFVHDAKANVTLS
jgi:hypothetical protein